MFRLIVCAIDVIRYGGKLVPDVGHALPKILEIANHIAKLIHG